MRPASVLMEASGSSSIEHDDEDRILEDLLHLFGSQFSLDDIASAFCEAGGDANVTAEILYGSQESGSHAASTSASTSVLIDESSLPELSENSLETITNSSSACKASKQKCVSSSRACKSSKQKCISVSIGTVSSVLGKDYSNSTILPRGSCKTTKPLKLNSDDFPMAEFRGKDELLVSTESKDPMHKDIEDFLYKMLGNGYQLSMDKIQEVLGCCGYDMEKSMETLLDLSASGLKKSSDIIGGFAENSVHNSPKLECEFRVENSQHKDIPPRKMKSLVHDKERYDLQRELLNSLFCAPEEPEESPKKSRAVRMVKKARPVRCNVVVSPPRDTTPEFSAQTVEIQQDIDDDVEEEDSYHVLRRVAKQHWLTMKEYYKAAIDAFAAGNHSLANELLEQGQIYNDKAREAEEKSAQKILEQSEKEKKDQVPIDLHALDTKEAIRLLKCHLSSLSGIPAFSHLKVIVETEATDITKGARKRWVIKLLEKESIKWTEEDNGRTIVIRVDEINPKKLSFAKRTH